MHISFAVTTRRFARCCIAVLAIDFSRAGAASPQPVWSSGAWSLQIVEDEFYRVGEGCELSLNRGGRIAHFTAFNMAGPVVVEGPEIPKLSDVRTITFTDPANQWSYRGWSTKASEPKDGRIELRLPSKNLVEALEGFAKLGTVALVVSDAGGNFELQLDMTGLPLAAAEFRKCISSLNLGL